jgi:hypothetical protein
MVIYGKTLKYNKELNKWILGIKFFIMDGFYIRRKKKEKNDISFCLGNLRTRLRRVGIVVD